MVHITIADEFRLNIDSSIVERAVETTLDNHSVDKHVSLSVIRANDERVHELNHKYRGVDAPTDVLSFPGGHNDPDDGSLYLGDVIVSYPRSQLQAEEHGHPVEDELQFLVIHGILHLLGFDHLSLEEKNRMWSAQETTAKKLNLSLDMPA